MKTSHRPRLLGILALVAGLAAAGCWDSKPEVQASASPGPLVRAPRPRPVRDERTALSRLEQRIEEHGTVRVLVHLEAPDLDPPAKPPRPIGTPRRPFDPGEQKRAIPPIAAAQSQFLEKIGRSEDANVVRFRRIPNISLTLGKAEVAKLRAWIEEAPPLSADRPFRIFVEEVHSLKRQVGPVMEDVPTIEAALAEMQVQDEPLVANDAPIVVVIDDRVDETLGFLHDHIEAIECITDALPQPLPLAAVVARSTPRFTLSHGTQVTCILAATAPQAKIVAIDASGPDDEIYTDDVLLALERVLTKWAVERPNRIAAVSMSLGDPLWATSSSCDDDNEVSIAFAQLVAELDELDIAVVVPSGNDGIFLDEVFFPGCISAAVTVGGTEMTDEATLSLLRVSSSNWGPLLDCSAKGTMIALDIEPDHDPFYIVGGTSMAVPFVAGAFAILRGANPDHTSTTLLDALLMTAVSVDDGNGIREIRVHTACEHLTPTTDATTTPVAPDPPPPETTPTSAPAAPGGGQ